MKQIILFSIIAFTLISCEKAIIGEETLNTPQNNFELFWNDFDQHYGLFEARDWDWDSIYQVYEPQITSQTTDEELWDIFKEMISYLDDSHTFIYNPGVDFFASGSEEDERTEAEFSLDLLKNDYLENVVDLDLIDDDEENFLFAKVKDKDIGYLYLSGIETNDYDFMDNVLSEIGKHKAIILDIRNNTGGDDEVATAIAGRFASTSELVYTVQTRNGINHNDFSKKMEYYSEALGKENYSKPVILLTDKITVSAAEVLGFHLSAFPAVTQIGDTTAGDFSDTGMRRFLPNGWQYQYSIMMFLDANGQSLDGVGHIPDIQIRNSAADIQAGNDKVMEKAVDFLFEEYGIQ